MRKLASIRKISALDKIDGADKIVKASVDGWALVTAIDNGFMVGDLVVYFEVDSFLPVEPRYEFLRKGCFKSTTHLGDGFRLKTIKLKGQTSQGLIMPVERGLDEEKLPCFMLTGTDGKQHVVHEGMDVTEILGVQLYEKPIPAQLAGKVKGNFPLLIRKTDQERAQNIVKELVYNLDSDWEVTMKLDGSSMTVYQKSGSFGVCSRNLDLFETEDNLFWQVAKSHRLQEQLSWLGKNYAFQGELMGPGVQSNREGLKKHMFFLYDIWDIDSQCYLGMEERHRIVNSLASSGFELYYCPFLEVTSLRKFVSEDKTIIENLLEYAEGPSLSHKVREGVVFKRFDGAASFKVISNTFLLGEKD